VWLSEQTNLGEVLLHLSYHLIRHHNQVNKIKRQLYWWTWGCGLIGSYSLQVVVHIWQFFDLCDVDVSSIPGFCGQLEL
jgi:uncharacterized membrane protein YdcZ (DUF606 family)